MDLLIVDDEVSYAQLLSERLERKGFDVTLVHTIEDALAKLQNHTFEIALLDQRLPDGDGLKLLHTAKAADPNLEAVILTGYGTIESAKEALKDGAYDYLTKPCNAAKLEFTLYKAWEKRRLAEQAAVLSEALRRQSGAGPIIGTSRAIKEVIEMVHRVLDSKATVMICGESGTGKELVARALHFWGENRDCPFQALNSAAIPAQLLESELFGYEKGAFTGANSAKKGLVEVADGGTLFLDEIGDMDLSVQAKLLRFLENGEFIRVGSTRTRRVNVRVVVATNRNLKEEVAEGRFREDLYYRLNVVMIDIPPLRERKEDIPLLAEYFLKNKGGSRVKKELSKESISALQDYDFPGNVRELSNIIERGYLLAKGYWIEPEHLFYPRIKGLNREELNREGLNREGPSKSEKGLAEMPDHAAEEAAPETALSLPEDDLQLGLQGDLSLQTLEKHHIQKVLKRVGGNKTQAAKLLGIGLRTLYRKIEEYGL
ncbi:sigma-54 dependent transcriptional regulator [Desulfitobacterium sp.]|uniref:sigma-54-dependent transcriptional regulator n=1 Tax=Desulfitobacterium sp. TaxID=49981 RepID=UPI002B216DBA|nr:sigma-54 dependent transcriptional regulator [Desulfitobacterium sp.]MEA4900346.1 sigma-54 dependent transcriptional regulator [Desulfitobacterium sp.]